MASPLEPLKHRPFLVYWLAGLSANFGWQIQLVGASWLMVLLGGTPQQVALVQTFVALPVMVLSLPGGAITDRVGQRATVLWAQSFLLVVSVALAVLAWFEVLTPVLLLLGTLLIGSGRALYYPGWQSMVLDFFSRDEAPAAFAINNGNLNIARSLGPAIGGAIVATAGAFLAFVVNALANISVLVVARGWSKPDRADGLPPEPFWSAIAAGIRYISLSPALLTLILRSFVFNLAAIAAMAILPLVAHDVIGAGPEAYGLLLGAFGAGSVAATLMLQPLRARVPLETCITGAFLVFAAALATLAFSTNLALSLVATACAGVCWIVVQVSFASTNHVSSPRWVMSRSIAIYQTFVFGGATIGSLLWGWIAQSFGTPAALYAAAATMAAGATLGLFLKIRTPDLAGLDPQSDWVPPTPRVDMVAKSGPIVTTITYRIREEDTAAFLEAMRVKRRHRMRDGAARWTLSRAIDDPMIWIERFKVATWAGTQRLHSRRTVAGGQAIEKVRQLHQGPGRPEVRYEIVRDPWSRRDPAGAPVPAI
ncbi:MFS transporter [Rhodobacterales bacterium HKCCE2091]|nr:MFS transporter [Rhodobacterales bacterium HKCCE2091]